MKRKFLALIAVILALFIAFSAAGCKAEKEPEEEIIDENIEKTEEPEQVEQTEQEEDDDHMHGSVTVERNSSGKNLKAPDGTTIVVSSISTPHIVSEEYPDAAEIINQYYDEQRDNHETYAQYELFDYASYSYTNYRSEFLTYYTEQFFFVEYNDNGYISIVRYIIDTVGDKVSNVVNAAETFELSSGGLVTGNYAFSDVAKVKKIVTEEVKAQITAQIEAGEATYYENWEEGVDTYFDPDSFYLSDDGVVFYYKLYEIADGTEGLRTFTISYDTLGDLFNLW